MYIFDTDHLSLIQRNGQEGKRILAKLAAIEDPEVAVTVITYEEQIRGRLAFLAKAKTLDEQIFAYQGLQQLAINYQAIAIVPFSRASALEHQRLRKAYPRLGNMDLKIAQILLYYFPMSRSYSACVPIQNQEIPFSTSIPTARYSLLILTDQYFPTRFKCKDGCDGLVLSNS